MKVLQLNRDAYIKIIEANNPKLRRDCRNNMFLAMSLWMTQNYFKKQSGIVSFKTNGRTRQLNPYLLCDGQHINRVEYYEMPILLSNADYRVWTASATTQRLIDLGILEKTEFSERKQMQLSGLNQESKQYFKLTELGKTLIPEHPEWRELSHREHSKVRKYLHLKNGTQHPIYKKLIRGLSDFLFVPPDFETFKVLHAGEFTGDDYQISPDELLKITYGQMQAFNNRTDDNFIFKCSSDLNTWGGRFYATTGYIKKFARSYLVSKATGEHLDEIDIQTCQFHMLNAVLRELFGPDATGQLHIDLVSGVDIYSKIENDVNNSIGRNEDQREIIKGCMFNCFFKGSFTPTWKTKPDVKKTMESVKKLYPKLVESVERLQHARISGFSRTYPFYFRYLKNGSRKYKRAHAVIAHKKVSFSATCKETAIMKKIWAELFKQGLQFVTVHDAILVCPNDVTIATTIILDVLEAELGYKPVLRAKQLMPPQSMAVSKAA